MIDVFTPVAVDVAAVVLAPMVGVVKVAAVAEMEVVGTLVVVGSSALAAVVGAGAG